MNAFKKTVLLGRTARGLTVHVTINYAGGRLSLQGIEGADASGNCGGACGQIAMHWTENYFQSFSFAHGWNLELALKLRAAWNRWHLNDLQAGSPRQREFLRQQPPMAFVEACAMLEAHGLQPDKEYLHNRKPYRYGTAWLSEPVPEEVLAWLAGLPDASEPLPKVWQR